MSMLNDRQIKELCEKGNIVDPYNPSNVGPCSLDLTLGDSVAWYSGTSGYVLDPENEETYQVQNAIVGRDIDKLFLEPGEFLLAETVEKFNIPRNIAAKVDGRSSMGRLGVFQHISAGFIDPGFRGSVTLELYNANRRPVILRPGMIVAQMCFFQIEPCERDYQDKGGRYQNESGATGSRYYQG